MTKENRGGGIDLKRCILSQQRKERELENSGNIKEEMKEKEGEKDKIEKEWR